MNNVIPFNNDEFSIRVVLIDGEQWFVGKDAAEALGYSDTVNAIKQHCKGVAKHHPLPTAGGVQDLRVINEPDLYRLIVGSTLPAAERFERWVFEEVLPSIRKTGSYHRPMSQAEMFLASAQAMVEMERKQAALEQATARVEQRVDQLVEYQLLTKRPSNAEAITHIRRRIFQEYGLPEHVVDQVMRQLPYSPKPAGMVKNTREEAEGASYAVYWTKDVNAVFRRFVGECTRVTPAFVTHPFIEARFRLAPTVEVRP